jgi:hypothetical protein
MPRTAEKRRSPAIIMFHVKHEVYVKIKIQMNGDRPNSFLSRNTAPPTTDGSIPKNGYSGMQRERPTDRKLH